MARPPRLVLFTPYSRSTPQQWPFALIVFPTNYHRSLLRSRDRDRFFKNTYQPITRRSGTRYHGFTTSDLTAYTSSVSLYKYTPCILIIEPITTLSHGRYFSKRLAFNHRDISHPHPNHRSWLGLYFSILSSIKTRCAEVAHFTRRSLVTSQSDPRRPGCKGICKTTGGLEDNQPLVQLSSCTDLATDTNRAYECSQWSSIFTLFAFLGLNEWSSVVGPHRCPKQLSSESHPRLNDQLIPEPGCSSSSPFALEIHGCVDTRLVQASGFYGISENEACF